MCAALLGSVYSGLSDEQAAADTMYSDVSDAGKHQQLILDIDFLVVCFLLSALEAYHPVVHPTVLITDAELIISSLAVAATVACTHFTYPWIDGQLEMAWVALLNTEVVYLM